MAVTLSLVTIAALGSGCPHAPPPAPPPAAASAPVTSNAALDVELARYEAVRLALVQGSLAAAKDGARLLAIMTSSGSSMVKRDRWGLARADAEQLSALLRQVSTAMKRLVQAPDLASARDAFADATLALLPWIAKVPHPNLKVVSCDALHRWWIQPAADPPTNPYAAGMSACDATP